MLIGLRLTELLLLGFIFLGPALTAVALVDVARRPASAWRAIEESQIIWALVVLIVAFVGPVYYLAVTRSKLAQVHRIGGSHAGF